MKLRNLCESLISVVRSVARGAAGRAALFFVSLCRRPNPSRGRLTDDLRVQESYMPCELARLEFYPMTPGAYARPTCPTCGRLLQLYDATDGQSRWSEWYCVVCDFSMGRSERGDGTREV
jgi:hypothetical protein